ncbi:phosphatidylserine decarboxylase family protein [Ichthyobacterium seriolicida]|uniref:Phosphatidylserine decarboxylase n=1 Tax=Ichthyobacterium seriolicida TaxID=242600 RepID=A0A1J1E439_9FLAO|nr:phosphatidylserine decarboxylase family protein [Ichthyobacterium seriolicida]BAV94086.1 phosphatidylserine decarboxylase [Ichthyobacterium seriolicida]
MIHKEGYGVLLNTFTILFFINIGLILYSPSQISVYVLIVSTALFSIILNFFRNPHRGVHGGGNYITSPVDGKVVILEKVYENEYFKDERIQISIFMSPLNVHVTRYPASGKVLFSKYHPGKYLVAWHPKSSIKNERTTVVLETNINKTEILYRQIAGFLARRIVNYAEEGKMVVQGDDSGFIKFGSRLDLFIPMDSTIDVSLNQKVKGGQLIAKIN